MSDNALATTVDSNGNPQADIKDAAQLLVDFWSPIFQERPICGTAAFEVMQFTPRVPTNIEWQLDKYQFRELIARPREGAPGPDGRSYSAWRLAGVEIMDVLFNAYEAFLGGTVLPEDFNHWTWLTGALWHLLRR